MKRTHLPFLSALLLWGAMICCYAGSSVTVDYDPNNIMQGETFSITYIYTGPFQDYDPDLEALKKDFILYGKSDTAQMTMVNGVSNMVTHLTLTLIPKTTGHLIIPSIRFAKGVSDPIHITVKEPGQIRVDNSATGAFMEATLSPKSQYIQAQVNYTLKLFYATNLASSNLTDPIAEDAVVMRTDTDKQYQVTRGKERYQVLERNYAIFPQKSGQLTIKSPMFTGIEQKDATTFNGMNNLMTTGGKPLRLRAKDLTIDIMPMHVDAQGQPWLPAKDVQMQESWSKQNNPIRVGDPITRTIIISAKGLTADQLPDLGSQPVANINVYPDKAQTKNSIQGGDILGQREENIAYIATRPGAITLPAISLQWFDVGAQQNRVVTLPSKVFHIFPALDATRIPSPQNTAKITKTEEQTSLANNNTSNWADVPIWIGLLALFAIAWILTLMAWLISFRSRKRTPVETKSATMQTVQPTPTQRRALNDIQTACTSHQAKKVRDSLLIWAKTQWPDEHIHNLALLAQKVGEGPLQDEILGLDEALYANKSTQWLGQSLWNELSLYKNQGQSKMKIQAPDLPPLYPS